MKKIESGVVYWNIRYNPAVRRSSNAGGWERELPPTAPARMQGFRASPASALCLRPPLFAKGKKVKNQKLTVPWKGGSQGCCRDSPARS